MSNCGFNLNSLKIKDFINRKKCNKCLKIIRGFRKEFSSQF